MEKTNVKLAFPSASLITDVPTFPPYASFSFASTF